MLDAGYWMLANKGVLEMFLPKSRIQNLVSSIPYPAFPRYSSFENVN